VVCLKPAGHRNLVEEVPYEPYEVPRDKAAVRKEGSDVTIMSSGGGMLEVLKVDEALTGEAMSVDVIDLRALKEMNTETLVTSVMKTKRLLTLDQFCCALCLAAEVITQVSESVEGARHKSCRSSTRLRQPRRRCSSTCVRTRTISREHLVRGSRWDGHLARLLVAHLVLVFRVFVLASTFADSAAALGPVWTVLPWIPRLISRFPFTVERGLLGALNLALLAMEAVLERWRPRQHLALAPFAELCGIRFGSR
jgi:hypothetical protein